MSLSQEQFTKSHLLFHEACRFHKVNPLIKEEALKEYQKLEEYLVINEKKSEDQLELPLQEQETVKSETVPKIQEQNVVSSVNSGKKESEHSKRSEKIVSQDEPS